MIPKITQEDPLPIQSILAWYMNKGNENVYFYKQVCRCIVISGFAKTHTYIYYKETYIHILAETKQS